ncbi:MAG: hypothetical protein AAB819_01320 [Patescibacteria group bacterium]
MHTQKHTIATIARFHLLPFVFLLGIALAPLSADAKSVMWTEARGGISTASGEGRLGTVVVHNPIFQVTYTASVRNLDTDILLSDGDVVPVGTRIRFEPKPYEDTDTFWFRTGEAYDSPYGYFTDDTSQPPEESWCLSDNVIFGSGASQVASWFALFTVVPPQSVSVEQTGSAGLSCDASGKECTVNSEGTIRSRVIFQETTGKVYFSSNYIPYSTAASDGWYWECALNLHYRLFGSSSVDSSRATARFPISSQTIPFTFRVREVPAANRPPLTPVITGPTVGKTGTSYGFSVVSTDPDGDQIRYGIDWDNDDAVDQWLPAEGFTSSGSSEPFSRTWSTIGAKTFRALAEDEWGLRSGFASHTIEIVTCPVAPRTYSCSYSGPSCEDRANDGKTITKTASCIATDICSGSQTFALTECTSRGLSCADVPEQCGRPDTTFREF